MLNIYKVQINVYIYILLRPYTIIRKPILLPYQLTHDVIIVYMREEMAVVTEQFPAQLWGRVIDFLFYDEAERVACASKNLKMHAFATVQRVNFRTIDSLVREVSHVRHFRKCFVKEVFIYNFFSMSKDGNGEFAVFAMPEKLSEGSRVISSICEYQHILGEGNPKTVILGHSWDYKIRTDEESGIDYLVPIEGWERGNRKQNYDSLFLTPVDASGEHQPNTYTPECTKFDFFLLALTAAYETSMLSQNVTIEGIPFWHPHGCTCKIQCHRCEGVCSFFPIEQIKENCNKAYPGFFPYDFKYSDGKKRRNLHGL